MGIWQLEAQDQSTWKIFGEVMEVELQELAMAIKQFDNLNYGSINYKFKYVDNSNVSENPILMFSIHFYHC